MAWPFSPPMSPATRAGLGQIPGLPSIPGQAGQAGESTFWSSYFFKAGTQLAGLSLRLFTVQLGQPGQGFEGRMGLQDTNLHDGGRLPCGFNVHRVQWLVREQVPSSDIEQLSQAFSRSSRDLMMEHGVLSWDFVQTRIRVGPLWLQQVEQSISIPERNSFAVLLEFGPGAPALEMDHVVRVCLVGEADREFGI